MDKETTKEPVKETSKAKMPVFSNVKKQDANIMQVVKHDNAHAPKPDATQTIKITQK